jgi:ketosteroid isomerase-like protein
MGVGAQKVARAEETSSVQQGAVQRADGALVEAIGKGDAAAASALLDEEFSWTDRSGKTRKKNEILEELKTLASEPDVDKETRDFGRVVVIRGNHRIASANVDVRFIRVWAKRAADWRVLVYQETKIAETPPTTRGGFGSSSGGAPVDCENPCKTVPYDPQGKAEKGIVDMWKGVERTVLTNDVEAWIPGFTDDFLFVTPDGGTPLNKADRVTMIKELKRTNTTLIPAKVESMQVWAFGDAAVMRSEHKPLHGRVLHVTRIFVKREGRWQIAFGQQTAVE